jgi:hypothetical protein
MEVVTVSISARMLWLSALAVAVGTQLCGQLGDATQNGPHILGYGYTLPTPVNVAPGELLTLMVNGTTLPLSGGYTVRAPAGADLPTTMAGVSIGYSQGNGWLAPIHSVHGFYGCGYQLLGRGSCTPLAAFTVQIPFEAQPCAPCAGEYLGSEQNGVPDLRVDSQSFADQVHILTSCDTILSNADGAPASATGLPCPSVVAHGDGSLVSVKSPAKGGEEIVVYAVGLGQTNPPLQTGKLVTAAAPTQTTYGLDFNYHPNALGSKPLPNAPPPVYAGATPGFVGLYQINFVVPPPPPGTPACVEPQGAPGAPPGQNIVYSNLTVSVGGQSSFDGARICVAAPST